MRSEKVVMNRARKRIRKRKERSEKALNKEKAQIELSLMEYLLTMKIPFSRTAKKVILSYSLPRSLSRENWFFSPIRTDMIFEDGLPGGVWKKFYCPIDLRGKTVLDVAVRTSHVPT
jgi:hypothetical protein